MAQKMLASTATGSVRCPYAFSSGRPCRRQCVLARASASSKDHQSIICTNTSSRRQILNSSSAAAAALLLTPLLQNQLAGPAAADEAETPVASAAESETAAAAAVAVEPAPTGPAKITEKITLEGAIRLTTNDLATRNMTPTDKQVYALNRRVQAQNRAPDDFPGFIREGFDITVVGESYVMDQDGLIYKDFQEGSGTNPVDGQQVVFDYTAYNESGAVIDSSYRKGRPAETRLGIQGLIPGFEMGIKGMKPGGKRRIVVPPALGPPVGPSTFFSAKQCEVFDVELRAVLKCERRQMLMFSDVVCE